MTPRFIALRWTPADSKYARRAAALVETLDPACWRKLMDRRGVLVFAHHSARDEILILPNEWGLIAGPLFDRRTNAPLTYLADADAEALVDRDGAGFFETYWGPCCAIVHNRARDLLHVLRDPAGGAPVYLHAGAGLSCIFTDLSDFLDLWDEPVACDEEMLGIYMVQPRMLTRRTALVGVSEILAGECVTLGRQDMARSMVWVPQARAQKTHAFDTAAAAVKSAIGASAQAWVAYNNAKGGRPIAHRLSGGLDSSIVLAALRDALGAGAQIICFNEYPEDTPEGDERPLARAAAKMAGYELVEHKSCVADFDYEAILHAPLPIRPTHSEFSHASKRLGDVIAATGARIVTSGQGGDQVLHRRRFGSIAVDAALDGIGIGRYFTIARETAMLARTPIWSIFAETLAVLGGSKASLFNPAFAKSVLASSDAVALAHCEWAEHPWADMARSQTPARAARAMHIADLSYYHEASQITRRFTTAPILAGQCVIEAVLAIAPYVMTEGGVDRALARAAFCDRLPAEIVSRTHKGDTTRFHNRILERQLPLMRALLLDGELTRRGLLERGAVEAALKRDFIADGALKGALMSAFMAEAWLQRFQRRPRTPQLQAAEQRWTSAQ